jgi:AcrR family transcriptional regulator
VNKQLSPQRSKESEIAEVALKLFLRHGFRKVHMSDIATACKISRPSLYAAFTNKDDVLRWIIQSWIEDNLAASELRLKTLSDTKARLECIFDIWVIKPYVLAQGSENAAELSNCAPVSAPLTAAQAWQEVEKLIARVLQQECSKKRGRVEKDLAWVLAQLAKSVKMTSANAEELRRVCDGIIAMTVAELREQGNERRIDR